MKSNVEKMKLERKMFRIIEQEIRHLERRRDEYVTGIARCLLEEYPACQMGAHMASFSMEAEDVIERIQQLTKSMGVDESFVRMVEAKVNYDEAYLDFVGRYYNYVAENEDAEEEELK